MGFDVRVGLLRLQSLAHEHREAIDYDDKYIGAAIDWIEDELNVDYDSQCICYTR